jgi:hypothetical protein
MRVRTTDLFGVLGRRGLGQADSDPAYMALPDAATLDPMAPPVPGMWRMVDHQGRKAVLMRSAGTFGEGGVNQQSCETVRTYEEWVQAGRVNMCDMGGAGAAPGTPAGTAPAPIPGAPPSGCNLPAGYGPDASGAAPAGKAVYACLQPDGTYNVFNQADNSPVMSQVSAACLTGFAGVNLLQPGDPRCGGAAGPATPVAQIPALDNPAVSNPGALPLSYPISNMWFPEGLEAPPISPINAARPPSSLPPPPTAPPQAPPMPTYAPGQPIPVTDWFGICIQKARGQ